MDTWFVQTYQASAVPIYESKFAHNYQCFRKQASLASALTYWLTAIFSAGFKAGSAVG